MPVNVVCKHKCSKKPHWHIKHLAICLQSAATGCRITALDDNAKIMSVYLGSLSPHCKEFPSPLPLECLYVLSYNSRRYNSLKKIIFGAYRANPFWKAPHIFSRLSQRNRLQFLFGKTLHWPGTVVNVK